MPKHPAGVCCLVVQHLASWIWVQPVDKYVSPFHCLAGLEVDVDHFEEVVHEEFLSALWVFALLDKILLVRVR